MELQDTAEYGVGGAALAAGQFALDRGEVGGRPAPVAALALNGLAGLGEPADHLPVGIDGFVRGFVRDFLSGLLALLRALTQVVVDTLRIRRLVGVG
ncbi:hypothetical protein [Streptomyces sp. NPDC002545]